MDNVKTHYFQDMLKRNISFIKYLVNLFKKMNYNVRILQIFTKRNFRNR